MASSVTFICKGFARKSRFDRANIARKSKFKLSQFARKSRFANFAVIDFSSYYLFPADSSVNYLLNKLQVGFKLNAS